MRSLCVLLCVLLAPVALAGPLNPPAGPITSTPGPEPRIAINAANTPGDNDATPSVFKITQPGSYYLTGNVTGVSGKSGIEIAASGVTIDLNGFELTGVPGSTSGILSLSSFTGIAIVNGSVRSWGGGGLAISASNTIIREIRAANNLGSGIIGGSAATISNCTARANGLVGIQCSDRCTLLNCTSSGNSSAGFSLGNACTISNCSSQSNTGNGISAGFFCTIDACTADQNSNGINVASSCTITDCSVAENTADGIVVAFQCLVRGNTVSLSTNAGIRAINSRNRIERNNVVSNGTSPTAVGVLVLGSGNIILGNSCSTNSAGNYNIVTGNRYGPIIDLTAGGAPPATGNSAASTLGSTDPNANYAY